MQKFCGLVAALAQGGRAIKNGGDIRKRYEAHCSLPLLACRGWNAAQTLVIFVTRWRWPRSAGPPFASAGPNHTTTIGQPLSPQVESRNSSGHAMVQRVADADRPVRADAELYPRDGGLVKRKSAAWRRCARRRGVEWMAADAARCYVWLVAREVRRSQPNRRSTSWSKRCRKGESNQAYRRRCGEQRSSLPGWVSNHCRWRQSSWQSDCGSRRGSPGIG